MSSLVWTSQLAQLVKNLLAVRETWVWSLGWEDPLEKGMATHSVLWPGEFHGLWSPWGCKELDLTERLSVFYVGSQRIACCGEKLPHIWRQRDISGVGGREKQEGNWVVSMTTHGEFSFIWTNHLAFCDYFSLKFTLSVFQLFCSILSLCLYLIMFLPLQPKS